MQQKTKKHAQLLLFSMIASCASSLAILLCILGEKSGAPIYLIIIPVLFWAGLAAEQYLFWSANALLKQILRENELRKLSARPGVIAPLQTKLGAVADLVFVISAIVFTVLMIGDWGKDVWQFVFLFLIVLSFRIHCITNGKNYLYKEYLNRRG